MKENAEKIQLVINTLETLTIQATQTNMDKLLGCMQVLGQIRDGLNSEVADGNTDTE